MLFKPKFIFFGLLLVKPVIFIFKNKNLYNIFIISNFFLGSYEEFILYKKENLKLDELIPSIYQIIKEICTICNKDLPLNKWSSNTANFLYKDKPSELKNTSEFEDFLKSYKFDLKKDITGYDELKHRMQIPIISDDNTFELIKESINTLYVNPNQNHFIHFFEYFENTIVVEFLYTNLPIFKNFSYHENDLKTIFGEFANYSKLFYRKSYFITNKKLQEIYLKLDDIDKNYSFPECLIVIYVYIIRHYLIFQRLKANLKRVQDNFFPDDKNK